MQGVENNKVRSLSYRVQGLRGLCGFRVQGFAESFFFGPRILVLVSILPTLHVTHLGARLQHNLSTSVVCYCWGIGISEIFRCWTPEASHPKTLASLGCAFSVLA